MRKLTLAQLLLLT